MIYYQKLFNLCTCFIYLHNWDHITISCVKRDCEWRKDINKFL